MAYDYNSRTKWEKERLSLWEKEKEKEILKLPAEKKELLREIGNFSMYLHDSFPVLRKWAKDHLKGKKLGEVILKECKDLIQILVPEEYREDYAYMLDQYPHFQYSRALFRPTVRTADPRAHVLDAFCLMQAYKVLSIYGLTPAQYLSAASPAPSFDDPELADFIKNDTYGRALHMPAFDDILAARLDRGDQEAIRAVEEAVLGDNNTALVSVPMIRGVFKSESAKLHALMGQFLLAARLQEGVRQAICENADCGRPEAFLGILKVIEDHDLIRFAGVKRAVATWTGIFHAEAADRVSAKLLSLMGRALKDPGAARAMTESEDSVEIVTGLWALGFYEGQDAVDRMLEIADGGTRNQRLAISYYNHYMQFSDFSEKAAKKVLETYPEDLQMAAAFLPTFLNYTDTVIRGCIRSSDGTSPYQVQEDKAVYDPLPVTEFYEDEEEARRFYGILWGLADQMKKKKLDFVPMVFPWYGVSLEKSDLVQRMVLTAYALQDQALIDQVCQRLSDISDAYYNTRRNYLRVLLHDPKTKIQKDALIGYAADKESMTRTAAWQILKRLPLSGADYRALEGHLRLKNEDTRHHVIDLLEMQEDGALEQSIERLLGSDKEMVRLAGLDLAKRRFEKGGEAKERCLAILRRILPDPAVLSEKEKVLYEAMTGESTDSALDREGYGLYDPAADYVPVLSGSRKAKKGLLGAAMEALAGQSEEDRILRDYFSLSGRELDQYFDRLKAFLDAHGKMEYKSTTGEPRLLENGLFLTNYNYSDPVEKRYPFPELWLEVYETILKSPEVVFNLYYALLPGYDEETVKDPAAFRKAEKTVFYGAYSGYHYADPKYGTSGSRRYSVFETILTIVMSQQKLTLPAGVARAAVKKALTVPEQVRWMEKVPSRYGNPEEKACFLRTGKFRSLILRARQFETDREFGEVFPLFYQADQIYAFEKTCPDRYGRSPVNLLSIYDYAKAFELGLISRDFLYKAAFEKVSLTFAVAQLGQIMVSPMSFTACRDVSPYLPVDMEKRTLQEESRFYKICRDLYGDLTDLILDVELKRGDTPTLFSPVVPRITRIWGIPRLMEILRALGNDPLDRGTYYAYSSQGTSRKECLSHLLKVCRSLPGETAEDLKAAVKKNRVGRERLTEVAMYAPQWMEMIEAVLGLEGFTSGCYYFMAHMNERFDDRKKAVIARYTPLSPEELSGGCFDTAWFFEVYEKLGEKNFAMLYKAAKYIADGSKHTRARKYADAATGKVDRDQLEKTIEDKRNKDLVMSYGLIPMQGRGDALHRYEFLQKFLKESRQFGAQRRQSEEKCVEYALKNMATTAGYADALRLTLAMESELVSAGASFFEGVSMGDLLAKVQVDENGKAALVLTRKGKALKSVPAALKKDPAYLEIKSFADRLKNQYTRCVAMFERAMEEEDPYSYGELRDLMKNPVTAGILGRLVFTQGTKEGLTGTLDQIAEKAPGPETLFYTAHPVTLFALGLLPAFQRLFFEKNKETGLKQPFKQVYREFYRKLEEEKEASDSRMFAGYQIQPGKTLAALKGRRWVADYESGLQKIYFRQNIAVTLYALADWFSPADTEAPTLEYVSFYDRRTYREKKLSEVPDILYSEVMRDVDLAVSVAHVGGVDPETSHSTIEMRKVILAFNMELFGLSNVTFEGTHAYIEGKLSSYSVQLGSGVIHTAAGAMVHILPVHSQQRGRVFLPFIDEDPKTAEILSKILLLARDEKIRDPYILDQIR